MKANILSAIIVLAFANLACGMDINLPEAPEPGPLVSDDITVPVPESGEARLTLSFGAGDLTLSPGTQQNLLEGTATYNYDEFKPLVMTQEADVSIQMGDREFGALPAFDELRNEWDFRLGEAPMELVIKAGAYDAQYEFGGLSLTNLSITDGAADVELSFSNPNPTRMNLLRYETGASNVKMEGLANANFSAMLFQAGAGDYTLDFSGDLQRDAAVEIETGFSNLILVIPEGLEAVVTVESSVANVNAGPGWEQSGNRYTLEGDSPTLTIMVEMGAGNLSLIK